MKNERHPFDPFSLVFGLAFATTGIAFAFGDVDALDIAPRALVAGMMLFLGALLLAFLWRRSAAEVETTNPDSEPDESLPTQPPPLS